MDNVTRDAVAARLKQARIAAGYETAAEAARTLRMKEATVRAHESGQNSISITNAPRYAALYHVSVNWLLYGHNEPPSKGELEAAIASHVRSDANFGGRFIPILGKVAAGVWYEVQPTEAHQVQGKLEVDVDGYQHANLYALQVVGPSMNLYYPEGRYVIVAPAAEAGVLAGDHVIVTRTRAGLVETTCKEVVLGEGGRVELWPRSTDPNFQTPIIMSGDEHDQDAPQITGVVVADYGRRQRGGLQSKAENFSPT